MRYVQGVISTMQDKSQKDYSKKILTLPNVLSFIRILLIPFMVWQLIFEENYVVTAILVVISGLTDVIDGVIARKFNMVSDLGKALDPVADKLTQVVLLFCLLKFFPYILVPFILLVIKEVFTGITQLIIIKRDNVVLGADWYGKLTTVLLYVTIFTHILWTAIPKIVSMIMLLVNTITMVGSCVMYGIRNIKFLLESQQNINEN